jgi:hypothetical protein
VGELHKESLGWALLAGAVNLGLRAQQLVDEVIVGGDAVNSLLGHHGSHTVGCICSVKR